MWYDAARHSDSLWILVTGSMFTECSKGICTLQSRKFLSRASHLILKTAQVLCFPMYSVSPPRAPGLWIGLNQDEDFGPDPSDPAFTAEILIEICGKKKVPIKCCSRI